MKRTRLNQYSLKMIEQLNTEVPIRIALCRRANGFPIKNIRTVYRDGKSYHITRIICTNGYCECGCGEKANYLEPHEKVFRSRGGRVSLENSIMVKHEHHNKLQNNNPIWSKK